jgi:hypothetical protein
MTCDLSEVILVRSLASEALTLGHMAATNGLDKAIAPTPYLDSRMDFSTSAKDSPTRDEAEHCSP